MAVFDTQNGVGQKGKTPAAAKKTFSLNLSSLAGMPETGPAHLVVNVSVKAAKTAGSVAVWSAHAASGRLSQMTYPKGGGTGTIVVPYQAGAALKVRASSAAHLQLTVSGWFAETSYAAVAPVVMLPAKGSKPAKVGKKALNVSFPSAVVAPGLALVRVQVNAVKATSVVLTPTDGARVQIAVTKGQSVRQLLIPVAADRKMKVTASSAAQVLIHALGYVTAAANAVSTSFIGSMNVKAKGTGSLQIADTSYVGGTGAVAVLVTAQAKKPTSVTLFPTGQSRPAASTITVPSTEPVTALVFVAPGNQGMVDVFSKDASVTVSLHSIAAFALPAGAISPTAVLLDAPQVVSASAVADDGTATATLTKTVRAGDVVVFPASATMPDGYIGRVQTATSANGVTTIATTAGSFLDVMPNTAVDVDLDTGVITLSEDDKVIAQSVSAQALKYDKTKSFSVTCSTAAEGKVEASFDYTLGKLRIDGGHDGWKWGVIPDKAYAEVFIRPKVSASFNASLEGKTDCALAADLGSVTLPTIKGFVYVVPFVWTQKITFGLDGALTAEAGASFAMGTSASMKLGARMGHDAKTYKDVTFDAGAAPAWNASLAGNLWLHANYEGKAYGVLGLNAGIGPELKLNVNPASTPWLSLRSFIRGELKAVADIVIERWETDALSLTLPENGWKAWEIGSAPAPIVSNGAKIAGGWGHTCAVLPSSAVECWGSNQYGQLGDGTTTDRATPVQVSGLSGVIAVSASAGHTCAVLSSGAAKCWGSNQYGQLGDGTTTDRATPVQVSGLTGVIAISAGASHTCAVLSSGAAKCWGRNRNSQLGNGTTTDRATPVQVSGLTGVIAISAGSGYTCAALLSGAKCWGRQFYLLDEGTSSTPVQFSGLSGVVAISSGASHTCAVLSSGAAKCWGSGFSGQLGDGTRGLSGTPVQVSDLSGVIAISAGFEYTCAVLSSGAAKCWGGNFSGELGDGTTIDRLTPVQVSGVSGATAITAGWGHTCALLSSGASKCWGNSFSDAIPRGD